MPDDFDIENYTKEVFFMFSGEKVLVDVYKRQLQQLLGHKRIDTTLQYAMVKQSNGKIAHRKYIG